ncbi:hypothetical protein [Streptomyces werraensis]|uniref:hypothetical protein n=1 Tax=Streptomyces werraensis TaxID=68284 RepID=UPI0033B8EF3D
MTTVMTEGPLWGHPQIAWLVRTGRRLRHTDRKRPWVLDTAVVLVVLVAFGLPDLFADRGHVAIVPVCVTWPGAAAEQQAEAYAFSVIAQTVTVPP